MKFSMIVEMTSLTPRVTFRIAAIPAQNAPTSMATTTMSSTCRGAGKATAPPTPAAMSAANAILTFDPDVEQVHPEADCRGNTGQIQHRRVVEDVDDVSVGRPGQHGVPERCDVVACCIQNQRRDDCSDDQRENWRSHAEERSTWPTHESSPAPVIADPSCCGVTVCGSNAPTILPRRIT